MSSSCTRRRLLQYGAVAGGSILFVPALTGCTKKGTEAAGSAAELDCTSTQGLAPADIATRNSLQYVDKSPDPNKLCSNCVLFKPPAQPETCGGCQVVKGPIHPNGHCSSWAPKPEEAAGQPS